MRDNGFFDRMCKDAMNELASGEKSWRDIEPNTLFLAAFGMLYNEMMHNLARPLWVFAGAVATGIIGYIIHLILGG